MADGLPVACSPTRVASVPIPRTYTRAHILRMQCTYATIQTQACTVSSVSDVAILADPSRRYSEIYGDATAGTLDCDRVREVAEEGKEENDRREERPEEQRECISRARNKRPYTCVWKRQRKKKREGERSVHAERKKKRVKVRVEKDTAR